MKYLISIGDKDIELLYKQPKLIKRSRKSVK